MTTSFPNNCSKVEYNPTWLDTCERLTAVPGVDIICGDPSPPPTTGPCQNGYERVNGVCVPIVAPPPTPCTGDGDCSNGTCIGGVCVPTPPPTPEPPTPPTPTPTPGPTPPPDGDPTTPGDGDVWVNPDPSGLCMQIFYWNRCTNGSPYPPDQWGDPIWTQLTAWDAQRQGCVTEILGWQPQGQGSSCGSIDGYTTPIASVTYKVLETINGVRVENTYTVDCVYGCGNANGVTSPMRFTLSATRPDHSGN